MSAFKILYILGTGRSGSTLIDILLGNSDKLLSLGEIYHTLACWIKNSECSCGQNCNDCLFWSRVKEQFLMEFSESDLPKLKKIQNIYERKALSPILLLFNRIFPTKNYKIYKKQLFYLYKAIASASPRSIFIDSSKNPLRAYVLKQIFKENLYLFHLVRDGRGALWSWIKSGIIPPFGISIKKGANDLPESSKYYFWWSPWIYSLSWLIYNIISTAVTGKSGNKRSLRLKYEAILTDPVQAIQLVSNFTNENLDDLKNRIINKQPLKTGHLIAGNRLRLLPEIKLREPDEEWRLKLFKSYNRVFWLIAGWLSKHYGYKY